MPTKLVLFYSQQQRGWSETWYAASAGDVRNVIQSALSDSVRSKCVSFRHPLTYLIGARATAIGTAKQSYSEQFGNAYHGLSLTVGQSTPDVASTDCVLAVDGIQTGRKRMYIRGLNDDDVKRSSDGEDVPSASLRTGLANYLNAMRIAGFGLRILVQPPNGGLSWTSCLRVIPVTGDASHADVITNDAVVNPIVKNGYVRFSRPPFNDLPGFPTTAKVIDVNPGGNNGVRISYFLREQAPVSTKYMQVTAVAYDYPAIAAVSAAATSTVSNPLIIERFSEHKTGRPFGLLRGRARSKVRAL